MLLPSAFITKISEFLFSFGPEKAILFPSGENFAPESNPFLLVNLFSFFPSASIIKISPLLVRVVSYISIICRVKRILFPSIDHVGTSSYNSLVVNLTTWPPSTFMVYISLSSWSRSEVNTIFFPSGDHSGNIYRILSVCIHSIDLIISIAIGVK